MEWLWFVLIPSLVALYALVKFVKWFTLPLVQSFSNQKPTEYKHQFVDPNNNNAKTPFPSLFSEPTVHISLIAPAYNEEKRLRPMMDDTLQFLKAFQQKNKQFTYEIIVVDDGSKDHTCNVALEYVKKEGVDTVRLLKLEKNQGKGGAVQQGMLNSRGKYLLMVDSDGATDIRDLEKVEKKLREIEKNGQGIALGSRAHLVDEAVATRKWYRNILMYGFHFLVSCLAVRGIKDTQCGFKLFTRQTARILFYNQKLRRWCFDAELLHLAQRLGNVPFVEVGVNWTEIPGSKLDIISSSLQMARDLFLIRFCYMTGVWKLEMPTEGGSKQKKNQ